MRIVLISCAVLSALLASVSFPALASIALYDDFSTPLINPAKWFSFAAHGTDTLLRVTDGALRMVYRAYGGLTSNDGNQSSAVGLHFLHPDGIMKMQATIRVTEYESIGCPGNGLPTFVRGRLVGFFFSSAPTDPGDISATVVATIGVGRLSNSTDPPGTL